MGLNQRASQQIWTPPNGPIVLVGTAATGIGMQAKSTNYAGQADSLNPNFNPGNRHAVAIAIHFKFLATDRHYGLRLLAGRCRVRD